MSSERIRNALHVQDWPPDHYSILGLQPGPIDVPELERRAAEQTERVRIFQLTEPEAATEALNRIAQALITLADPEAKLAYDRSRIQVIASSNINLAEPDSASREPSPPVPGKVESEPKAQRRAQYRALVQIRKLRRTWHTLGPLLFDRPARQLDLFESMQLLRQLWFIRQQVPKADSLSPWVSGPSGAIILALAHRERPLRTVRALSERDRQRLFADWNAAATILDQRYQDLALRLRRARNRKWLLFVRAVRRNWLDLSYWLIGFIALCIALWRTR